MSRRDEPRGARLHAQVLIVLGMLLFGGRGGGQAFDLETAVRELVGEESRVEPAARTAADIGREVQAARERVLAFRQTLLEEFEPYEATPEGLDALAADFDTAMWTHQERLLALRGRLLEQLSPQEWDELYARMRAARRP